MQTIFSLLSSYSWSEEKFDTIISKLIEQHPDQQSFLETTQKIVKKRVLRHQQHLRGNDSLKQALGYHLQSLPQISTHRLNLSLAAGYVVKNDRWGGYCYMFPNHHTNKTNKNTLIFTNSKSRKDHLPHEKQHAIYFTLIEIFAYLEKNNLMHSGEWSNGTIARFTRDEIAEYLKSQKMDERFWQIVINSALSHAKNEILVRNGLLPETGSYHEFKKIINLLEIKNARVDKKQAQEKYEQFIYNAEQSYRVIRNCYQAFGLNQRLHNLNYHLAQINIRDWQKSAVFTEASSLIDVRNEIKKTNKSILFAIVKSVFRGNGCTQNALALFNELRKIKNDFYTECRNNQENELFSIIKKHSDIVNKLTQKFIKYKNNLLKINPTTPHI
ncbi:hypothetical protein KKE34_02760 [Patescibacteria group bacterium]|nr:hypothetical protein [Patescibacteria group bacterium]MBU1885510.1 hypothetical protein [Patescibacteria group bacterium]